MSAQNASRPSSGVRALVADATARLADAGVASPEVDARLLAADLLGVRPLQVFMVDDVPAGFAADYAALVDRRAAREPLQHILGAADFGGLELAVGPGVFVPRPETEVLAEWAVGRLALVDDPVVVDLGTGTGALALFIATSRPDATVSAVEKSAAARDFARRNAEAVGASISIVDGDMTDPQLLMDLSGTVDLVVANPPYVPETDGLDPEVYADPHDAVFSGADGMDAIRGLLPVAARLLNDDGALGLEHDDTTSAAVLDAVRATGQFAEPEVLQDLTGRDRFVVAGKLARE